MKWSLLRGFLCHPRIDRPKNGTKHGFHDRWWCPALKQISKTSRQIRLVVYREPSVNSVPLLLKEHHNKKSLKKENNKKQFPTLLRSPFWTIIPSILFGGFWKIWMMSLLCRNIFQDAKKSQRSKHFMYNLICYYIPTDWRVILLPFFLFQEKITFPTLLFLLIDVWIYDCKSQYTIHKFYLWTIKSLSLFLNHRVKCRV